MRLPEQRVWDALKSAKCGVRELKFERVENATNDGNPDVHGGNRNGVEFWLELKVVPKMPVRNSTPVVATAMRPAQVAWHRDWAQYGILSFVLVKIGQEVHLLSGPTACGVTKGSLQEASLAQGFVGAVKYLAGLKKGARDEVSAETAPGARAGEV